MPKGFRRGDAVTVMPPYDDDPLILSFQHYGRIVKVCGDPEKEGIAYYVVLGSTWPTDQAFGPFPAARLRSGWRNEDDHWRAAPRP